MTSKQSEIGNEKIARPDRIYVYDFVATPTDLAPEDVSTAQYAAPSAPQSAKEIEAGRKLGSLSRQTSSRRFRRWGCLRPKPPPQRHPRTATSSSAATSSRSKRAARQARGAFGSGKGRV
jgi:hypothetical protein